jgi:hypothetical protein
MFGIRFPMTSFRYSNMTNDGTNDVSNTYKLAPKIPFTRLEGTKITVEWIRKHEEIK